MWKGMPVNLHPGPVLQSASANLHPGPVLQSGAGPAGDVQVHCVVSLS